MSFLLKALAWGWGGLLKFQQIFLGHQPLAVSHQASGAPTVPVNLGLGSESIRGVSVEFGVSDAFGGLLGDRSVITTNDGLNRPGFPGE